LLKDHFRKWIIVFNCNISTCTGFPKAKIKKEFISIFDKFKGMQKRCGHLYLSKWMERDTEIRVF
jgi:hypothetical protein